MLGNIAVGDPGTGDSPFGLSKVNSNLLQMDGIHGQFYPLYIPCIWKMAMEIMECCCSHPVVPETCVSSLLLTKTPIMCPPASWSRHMYITTGMTSYIINIFTFSIPF